MQCLGIYFTSRKIW